MENHSNFATLAIIMKAIIMSFILLPCLAFSQATKEDYSIYSQYLELYQDNSTIKINFIIRKSTDYIRKYDKTSIEEIIDELRGFVNSDKEAIDIVATLHRSFVPILKKDTLWISLIAELNQEMQSKFFIKNEFSPGLGVTVINNRIYNKYFKQRKNIEKHWDRFHAHYGKSSLLIDFSEIVNDGKHAVFYFASRCGGLCGGGYLVLFYKDGLEWKFLQTLNIWIS